MLRGKNLLQVCNSFRNLRKLAVLLFGLSDKDIYFCDKTNKCDIIVDKQLLS